jgi:hypothetical protein
VEKERPEADRPLKSPTERHTQTGRVTSLFLLPGAAEKTHRANFMESAGRRCVSRVVCTYEVASRSVPKA